MQFSGPRPACQAIDSLIDKIGDPTVALIKDLPLSEGDKAAFITKFEQVLIDNFSGEDSVGWQVRNYIYELSRRQS